MSDCGFCIGSGDYDRPDFCTITIRTARKLHKCCECGREIKPGQNYEITSGKWDGDLSTYKTCMICKEIREAFCCDGWTYTGFWDDVYEILLPAMTTGCLDRLSTPEAKRYLLEKWNEWKFER